MTEEYLFDRMYRYVDTADDGASRHVVEQTAHRCRDSVSGAHLASRALCQSCGYAK